MSLAIAASSAGPVSLKSVSLVSIALNLQPNTMVAFWMMACAWSAQYTTILCLHGPAAGGHMSDSPCVRKVFLCLFLGDMGSPLRRVFSFLMSAARRTTIAAEALV